MSSIGQLIFVSVRPLVKLIIPTAAGFAVTRAKLFPASASRSVAQVLLAIFLPALLFSKVVTAIDTNNVSALGVIVLVCFFYQLVGGVLGCLVLVSFPVPSNFRYGLIVCCVWSNFGDLPTAVVQSVTGSPPFAAGDSDLSVAFVAVFIVAWYFSLFPLQGHQLIKLDYARDPIEDDEMVRRFKLRILSPLDRCRGRSRRQRKAHSSDVDLPSLQRRPSLVSKISNDAEKAAPSAGHAPIARRVTLREAEAIAAGPSVEHVTSRDSAHPPANVGSDADSDAASSKDRTRSQLFLHTAWLRLRAFLSPPTVALLTALVIALVAPLKALFVQTSYPMPSAPDGKPPLAILLETATFIGNASVPTGLLILGASLARMSIPRPLSKLPLRSIFAVAVVKMCIMPILGVLLVDALVRGGLVAESAKVLRFTLIYFSVVPSATFQVALSQVYAPEGVESNSSVLCSYLILQYLFLIITGTVTTAYTLSKLF